MRHIQEVSLMSTKSEKAIQIELMKNKNEKKEGKYNFKWQIKTEIHWS